MESRLLARARLTTWWVVAAAAGAATVQVGVSWVRHLFLHQFIWVSRDFTWMVPAGYLLLFGAVAAPFTVLLAPFSPRAGERVAGFVFGTVGTLAVLVLLPWLHPVAALVLALAFGVRMATLDAATRGWAPRWGVALLAFLGVSGLVEATARGAAERRATASLPPAASSAPNVLFIILDTVRAASMSFMGYARETTPQLATVAAEGTIFDQAYATAPWTLPSHAGMFTAQYPSSLTADWRVPLLDHTPTLAEAFRSAGYHTVGFAANHFYTSWESGLTRGFVTYRDYKRSWKQALLSVSLLQTEFFWGVVHDLSPGNVMRQVAHLNLRTQVMWTSDRLEAAPLVSQFLEWEGGRRMERRPWFAFLNLYDAHLPYDPPADLRRKFSPNPGPLDRYDASIAYMDRELGRLLDDLRSRGVLDNTVVIIAADHGEGFGEHGLHGHGNSLYRSELHVPLIIRYPARVPAGYRVTEAVSLRDIAATAIDLAELHTTKAPGGASLAATWNGGRAPSPVISQVSAGINTEPHLPVSRGAMRSLIDSTSHYIRNGDGVEEVYAYRSDSAEAKDLARQDTTRVMRLRARARVPGAGRR